MTGDSQRGDDSDFLDDDFIVEDIAAKNEDLDRLFEMPNTPNAAAGASPATEEQQSDEALFTDHTKGLDPSQRFEGGPEFAEGGPSTWNGEALELEPKGAPKAGDAKSRQKPGADLEAEEEFELDSDSTLEVVGAPEAGDGIEQFENSGPFTLDDGEESAPEQETASEPIGELRESSGDASDEATREPGWEPLPSTGVDTLAEVPELARADDEGAVEPEGELVGAGVDGDSEAVDSLDHTVIRSMQPSMTQVGSPRARGRTRRLLVALAASLMVLGAGAAVVFRPELFGLQLEPQRVEQARLERPEIVVKVPQPAGPSEQTDVVQVPVPTPPVAQPVPPTELPPAGQLPTPPVGSDPINPAPPTPPVEVPVVSPTPTEPAPPTAVPGVVVAPTPETAGWPVPVRAAETVKIGSQGGLIRISDELKIGEHTAEVPRPMNAVEGVMPGSRAFAQLHNGNYFIGSVKHSDSERVTLKLDDGEITLPLSGIARFTELGSADYAELQKVTSGFVRLLNNNRLVGGILSHIADDYVVLEVRRNRVMLPRSAIGAFVQGDDEQAVRLDTTAEEDNWLRKLAERELGTGQPTLLPATPPATPPTATPAPVAPPR